MPVTAPARHMPPPPAGPAREDHVVRLRGATWDDYVRVVAARGDRSAPRIAFGDGVIEILSPALHHEAIRSNLGRLVEVWLEHRGIDYRTVGSWTQESEVAERAAEPDESFVLSGDLERPARPDLVIEVVWTHRGLGKPDIYASFGVPEVWVWEHGAIQVHVLRGDAYTPSPTSEVLPGIDLSRLASFATLTSTSEAKRGYRAALGG